MACPRKRHFGGQTPSKLACRPPNPQFRGRDHLKTPGSPPNPQYRGRDLHINRTLQRILPYQALHKGYETERAQSRRSEPSRSARAAGFERLAIVYAKRAALQPSPSTLHPTQGYTSQGQPSKGSPYRWKQLI